ncbi:hypothetical protein HK100_002937, partial [Physocladia obscura]
MSATAKVTAISETINIVRKEGAHEINMHLPTKEQPIQKALFAFRHSLNAMRKDSHDALTLADINAKATELSAIMLQLRDARANEVDVDIPRNRVDDLLDSVWMTITIDALRASEAWTPADIEPLQERLRVLDETVSVTEGKFVAPNAAFSGDQIPFGQAVLTSLLNRIHRTVAYLNAENESGNFEELKIELNGILAQLTAFESETYTIDSLIPLSKRLHAIDSGRNQSGIEPGQATIGGILNICFEKLTSLVADLDPVTESSPLFLAFSSLTAINTELSRIELNVSLRSNPSELGNVIAAVYIRLQEIESHRVNGTFVPDTSSFDAAIKLPGQATMHKLLHDSHAKISRLVDPLSGPIVGESLISEYELLIKQRTTLRKLRAYASAGWNVSADLEKVEQILKTVEGRKVKGLFVGEQQGESAKDAEDDLILRGATEHSSFKHLFASATGFPDGQAVISAIVDECDSL